MTWQNNLQQLMQQSGYIPALSKSQNPAVYPLSEEDSEVLGKTPTGLPDGWDYKTSPLGPKNEPLPQGATGWTPQGEPFYGGESAIGNWWNGLVARWNAPVEAKQDRVTFSSAGEQAADFNKSLFSGDFGGALSNLIGTWSKIFKWGGQTLAELGGQPVSDKEEKPAASTLAVRGISEVVKGGLSLLQEGAQQIEQVRGGLQEAGEAIGWGDSFTSQGLEQIAADGNAKWPEAMLYSIDPIGLGWDVIRGVAGLISGKTEAFSEGYQAGRILYSRVLNPLLQDEFVRRYRDGENPYLLAQELQDPGAELAGQLFADPLLLYGAVVKAIRNTGWADNAAKYVGTVQDSGILTKLGGQAISESERIGNLGKVIDDIPRWLGDVEAGKLVDINRIGFRSLTARGMRYSVGVTTGSFFKEIVSTMKINRGAGYLDDTMEAARGFWLMASKDTKEVTEGLNILSRYLPTNVVLSQAGGEFAVFLRKMLPEAADATSFVSKLSKGQEAESVIARLAKNIDGVSDEEKLQKATTLFNSFSDDQRVIAQNEALLSDYSKKIDAFTEKFIPTMSERIALGENVGLKGRAIATFDRLAYSAPVRGINNFFGIVYMGTSPGYAFRNIVNNAFTIFTDRGVGSAIDYLKPAGGAEAYSELQKIGGGVVDFAAKEGIGPIGALTGIEGKGGGVLRTFTKVSNNWESKASLILYRDGVVDTMNRVVLATFRDTAIVSELSKGKIDANLLRRFIVENNFNAKEGFRIYREAIKTGYSDLLGTGLWMSEGNRAALKEYGWLDDYLKAITEAGDDVASKQKASDAFFKDRVEAFAAEATKEQLAMVQDASDHLPGIPVKASNLNTFRKDLTSNAYQKWWDGLTNTFRQADAIAGGKVAGQEVPRILQPLFDKNPRYYELIRGGGIEETIADTVQLERNLSWDWRLKEYERVVKGNLLNRAGMDFAEVAKQLGMPADIAETVTTKSELIDKFWTEYFDFARNTFARGRVEYGSLASDFLEEAYKLDPRLVNRRDIDVSLDAMQYAERMDGAAIGKNGYLFDAEGKKIVYVPYGGHGDFPTLPRAHAEGLDGQRVLFKQLNQELAKADGVRVPVIGDQVTAETLDRLEREITSRMTQGRFVAGQVGKRYRDFGIHDYAARTNMDTAAGLIYPYQFWHTRTYKNWFSRLLTDPAVIAAYAKYKNYMSEIHAGLPEWWKYNVQVNEVLGIKFDHPLFFNLEQTLNPLNGLTGVDFNDPNKRINWYTNTLDDLNKLGPSTWTPLSILAAIGLYAQGENDAAARWAGRLIPQTALAEGIGGLAGLDPFSLDPFVNLFSNGIDPYTRRRVGRALAAMVNEDIISEEQAIDAAHTQSGEWWNLAWQRAVGERAPGQLSSFILGTGFKARSLSDIQIDNFYSDYNSLWNLYDTLSPTEFQQGMNGLRTQYPFMDTVLLANKNDDKRDTALAYNVLNRIPPGNSSLTENAGLDPRLLNRFYEDKGDLSKWEETDRNRFMATIVDMSAILATPADATRQEWSSVRGMYGQINDALKTRFGADILDQIDNFYAQYATNRDTAPSEIVSQALDYKQQAVASNPLLATYYGGLDSIFKYYQGLMYGDIETKLGEDFFVRMGNSQVSSSDRKRYYAIKDTWLARIDQVVLRVGKTLPEARGAEVREDVSPSTLAQEDFLESLQEPVVTEAEIVNQIGESGYDVLQDYLQGGAPMPYWLRNDVAEFAESRGLTFFGLMDILRTQPAMLVQ